MSYTEFSNYTTQYTIDPRSLELYIMRQQSKWLSEWKMQFITTVINELRLDKSLTYSTVELMKTAILENDIMAISMLIGGIKEHIKQEVIVELKEQLLEELKK